MMFIIHIKPVVRSHCSYELYLLVNTLTTVVVQWWINCIKRESHGFVKSIGLGSNYIYGVEFCDKSFTPNNTY